MGHILIMGETVHQLRIVVQLIALRNP